VTTPAPGSPAPAARPALWPWLLVAALVAALDQASKWAIAAQFAYAERINLLPFFDLTLVYNPGAAFSFLADAGGWQRWFFTALAAVAVVFIIWLLHRHRGQRRFNLALAVILGGALGNLIDRSLHGHVVDFGTSRRSTSPMQASAAARGC